MQDETPCCAAAAARTARKLTLPDGLQVGMVSLGSILKEVADLKLSDSKAVKRELLNRVKIRNYVAPGAENDYSMALFQEYRRHLRESKQKGSQHGSDRHS